MTGSYKGYTFEDFFHDNMESERASIRKNSEKLWNTYILIKDKMEIELDVIKKFFPHYSSHDADHSKKIIQSIEKMLGEEHWKNITLTDAWMFLCCAYLHDIGMIISNTELIEDMKTSEFTDFINKTKNSSDEHLRLAAEHISILKREEIETPFTWGVAIQRDIMFLAAEFYRPKHANRVEKVIKERFSNYFQAILVENGFPSRIVSQMAEISAMHGVSFEYMLEKLDINDSVLNITYHPRLVAILLRLGDLCDYDCDRFSIEWVEANGGLTKTNLIHYYKHQFVKKNNISPEKIFIKVNIDFQKIKEEISGEKEIVHHIIEKDLRITEDYAQCEFCNLVVVEANGWLNWLKEELQNMKKSWNEIANNEIPLLEPAYACEVFVNEEKPIFEEKNIRFVFSNEKAYSLIEGYSLYDDQLIFVRELIQNSLDALKIKFWHDLRGGRYSHEIEEEVLNKLPRKEGKINYSDLQPFDFKNTSVYDNYKVIVRVEHKEEEEQAKFIIEDNGIGISIEDLKNKIVNTGSSWNSDKSKKDMEEMPKWLQPTGAFGIGLHSVFALADTIYIQTKSEQEREGYEMILHSGKRDGYVLVNKNKKEISFCGMYSTGTHIEVILDMKRYKNRSNTQDDSIIPEEEIFIDRPESNLCFAIEEKIEELFVHPLFGIEYTCGEHTNVCEKFFQLSKYSLLFDKDKRNKLCDIFYREKDYDFVLDNFGRDIIIWLKKGIVFYFSFDKDNEYSDIIDTPIYCKGINVKNAKVKYILPWIELKEIDIFSGNGNDILIASRNELKEEYKNKIIKILEEVNQEITEIYFRLLLELEKKEEVIQWGEDLKKIENLYKKKKEKNYSEKAIIKLAEKYKNKEIGDSKEGVSVYILEQIIFCILNQEVEESKKIIRQEKEITTTKLGKKIKEKVKKESYLIELITNFINIFKNMLGSELGKELESEFVNELGSRLGSGFVSEFISEFVSELGRELGNEAENEFVNELGSEFVSEFRSEFRSELVRELEKELEKELARKLVRDLRRALVSKEGRSLQRIFTNMKGILNQPYFKKNSLNFIAILPFYSIIWLIYTTKAYHNMSILRGILTNKVFSNATGYNFGYYFIGKKDIGEILTSKTLEIYEKDFYYTARKLPFISYIPCNSLLIEEDNKLMLNFDMTNLETRAIEIETIFVLKSYLEESLGTIIIPSFKSYEKIAIKEKPTINRYNRKLFSKKNYAMVLWQEFQKIKEYLLCLEEKQAFINKLMNYEGEEGNRVKQAINYTYHHRAYMNENETYEQAMEGIRETYKQFISDVLDCVLLSDEELKEIRYENREITL